jgi:hypothetical protein
VKHNNSLQWDVLAFGGAAPEPGRLSLLASYQSSSKRKAARLCAGTSRRVVTRSLSRLVIVFSGLGVFRERVGVRDKHRVLRTNPHPCPLPEMA